jgi:glutamyl-tRNA reductase
MSKPFKSFDNDSIKKITESEEFKKASSEKNVQDLVNNEQFQQFKDKYKNKSDDEILKDASEYGKKLKEQYGEKEYNKKIQDLKNFEKFLSPEQKKKMKKFLDGIK